MPPSAIPGTESPDATRRREQVVLLGDSVIRTPATGGVGAWAERDGERFYRIANYHVMAPFLMSVVSGYDHWLFVSSTGGVTCGRRSPGNALFPYGTDDKIHDACATTGPRTVILASRGGATRLWQPFDASTTVYDIERNLYKNVPGNKLAFEEINRDLGLAFTYAWSSGSRFGFVRSAQLVNTGRDEVRVELLDGLRNLLPYGVDRVAQAELSTLVDAYKQAERVPDLCAGIYTLSSILTDRAEPSEALKATVAWSTGLPGAQVLLSEDQIHAFCSGGEVRPETFVRGKRGAFFVRSGFDLSPQSERRWFLLADVERGPSQTAELLHAMRQGVAAVDIERDVDAGTARLEFLVGRADGIQKSADDLVTARQFSNALFNIMRGGVFPDGYRFSAGDFLCFVGERNRSVFPVVESALRTLEGPLTLESALKLAERTGDETFTRLVHEYLPLTFSRRHGDPSRPWNLFSITTWNGDGSEYPSYEGNWRDIFQNWEALALSYPEYIESFIAKFVNASTLDGHNPYRISRGGIEWEILDPQHPWSNIGYWGDHQVGYLLRFLELSHRFHPGRLHDLLGRELFVYADVPYRIRPYREILRDPRSTVEFDEACARAAAERVAATGSDGKLLTLGDGSIYRVNLLEKLLVPALARLCNLVPGGGIWMNTQRPEWNDANNALVGYGLSMVTLCYLRRYLLALRDILDASPASRFHVSEEVLGLFDGVGSVLRHHVGLLEAPVGAEARKSFMDDLGAVSDRYRAAVYGGPSGAKAPLGAQDLQDLVALAMRYLDHTLALGRRPDGLFHSYNLVRFDADGHSVEPLEEMLEGQVAALSSGVLAPEASLALLEAIRTSRLYREDQNSYLLYPDRKLPSFLEKNVLPPSLAEGTSWIRKELESGRTDYVERDVDGKVHFNGRFRNAAELRAALERDSEAAKEDVDRLCEVYEAVFSHRRFTGRSGSMYKYEGLGCVYWHMVSKLLLATGEVIARAVAEGADDAVVDALIARFRDIQDGLGTHKSPSEYGAFPIDPYSHTPDFTGVQQPGLTGQVKEDLITRYGQLGVHVERGEIVFRPFMLDSDEFLREPSGWSHLDGHTKVTEALPAGSLAFTLCGVPVVYRLAESRRLLVLDQTGATTVLEGSRLGRDLSQSLFRREGRVRKLVVELGDVAAR